MNQELVTESSTQPAQTNLLLEDDENFGWSFHKWPFLVSLGIVVVFYLLVFLFVDEFPQHIDPSDLPPPPWN